MKKFFILISNYHEQILKYVIILGAVLLIVAALPYDTQFNFEIHKGKPWPYESLIAPSDFPIYKSDLELTQEKIEATKNVHPVFVMDTAVATQKMAGFKEAFNAQFPALKSTGLDACLSLLNTVYERGIIQFAERPNLQNLSTVTLLRNNFAEDV